MAADPIYFQWPDYVVLAVVLLLSASIGFYYAFSGGKQKTTREYLFADKNMPWFPVSCSLLASFVSSLNIISLPAEIYSFGTIFMLGFFFWPVGIFISTRYYIPVFYNLKVVSVFKYLELRFGKAVKLTVEWTVVLNQLVVTGLVIYGPSLAVSAVTGINLWVSVALMTGVSLLYTVLGGMKAVLWTDTLQLLIIFAGIFTVFIAGVIREGGFTEITRVSRKSGRLDVLEWQKVLDFDPRARHTLWNQASAGILLGISQFGINQVSIMRALTLGSDKQIIKAYSVAAIGKTVFTLMCAVMGLVIFSFNRYCDPRKNGEIFSKDQYYPLFVMKFFGHMPGLPGFILSAIFSGSLSTISSLVNASATILMTDIIKPLRPQMTDQQATVVTKILSIVFGALSVVFTLFAKNFGSSLISMLMTVLGVFGGPSLAVFSMGIFLPFVNRRAVLIAFICGAVYSGWTGIGGLISKPYVYAYPLSTAGCNITNTSEFVNISSPTYDPSTWNPKSHYRTGVDAIYDLSYVWTKAAGILVTTLVAVIVSSITNRTKKHKVNYRLLTPRLTQSKVLCKFWKEYIDFTEDESIVASAPNTDDDGQITSEEKGEVNKGVELDDLET